MKREDIKSFIRMCKIHEKNYMYKIGLNLFGDDAEEIISNIYNKINKSRSLQNAGFMEYFNNFNFFQNSKKDMADFYDQTYNLNMSETANPTTKYDYDINNYEIKYDKLSNNEYFKKIFFVFFVLAKKINLGTYEESLITEFDNLLESLDNIKFSCNKNNKKNNKKLLESETLKNKMFEKNSKTLFSNILCEAFVDDVNQLKKCGEQIKNVKVVKFDLNNITANDLFVLYLLKTTTTSENEEEKCRIIDLIYLTLENADKMLNLENIYNCLLIYNTISKTINENDENDETFTNLVNKFEKYEQQVTQRADGA